MEHRIYQPVFPLGQEEDCSPLFSNLSPNPEEGYFADGMTEELITSLSGVRQLTVIVRTSVMGYKGSTKKAKEIGRELDVGSMLEGSA